MQCISLRTENLELEGGDTTLMPRFRKTEAELYFNQFFRESMLSVNVDYNRDAFNYYGYPERSCCQNRYLKKIKPLIISGQIKHFRKVESA
jgi:hypothetical protein